MNAYQEYLKEDLEKVRSTLEDVFLVQGNLMSEVAVYVRDTQGKMLRPAMVCLASRAFGFDPDTNRHTDLGASLELFHVATLLHDDVIDNAELRRGKPTVNRKWGNDVAILFADYLYASCFDLALNALNPEIVQVLTKTTQRMTEGEMYQIEKRDQWLSVDDYYSIIRSKTAYLFSASTGLGAILAGESPETVQKMFDFGMNFGMAFQITDDALDYEAQGDQWGKRVGADLKEGKQTLPLLYTLEGASPSDREDLIRELNNGRDFDVVHGYVKRYGGIDHSLEVAADYTRKALENLQSLDLSNEPISIMKEIADSVIVRQF